MDSGEVLAVIGNSSMASCIISFLIQDSLNIPIQSIVNSVISSWWIAFVDGHWLIIRSKFVSIAEKVNKITD